MAQPATNPKIEELRFRLKTDPKNRIFYPLAEELRKVGQFAEAEQVLRTGLTSHATYLSAWVSLGRVLRELKNDGAAVEALNKALQLDPENVVAARLLADAYLSMGEKVEAIKKYKLVHALLPADEDVEATIERLDLELNPPAVAAPESPFAAEPEGAVAPPPAQAEESPFAPETAPFEAPLHEAAAPQAAPAEAESPFAPQPAAFGDETATFPRGKRIIEEPASNSAAASEVESPEGMHIAREPLAPVLPPELPAGELPPPETAASPAPAAADEADVFAPVAEPFAGATREEPIPASAGQEEITNTLTMADLYAKQGLIMEAREIYENILQRDPGNAVVRDKLAELAAPAEPPAHDARVTKLEGWLARVRKREAGRV